MFKHAYFAYGFSHFPIGKCKQKHMKNTHFRAPGYNCHLADGGLRRADNINLQIRRFKFMAPMHNYVPYLAMSWPSEFSVSLHGGKCLESVGFRHSTRIDMAI